MSMIRTSLDHIASHQCLPLYVCVWKIASCVVCTLSCLSRAFFLKSGMSMREVGGKGDSGGKGQKGQ